MNDVNTMIFIDRSYYVAGRKVNHWPNIPHRTKNRTNVTFNHIFEQCRTIDCMVNILLNLLYAEEWLSTSVECIESFGIFLYHFSSFACFGFYCLRSFHCFCCCWFGSQICCGGGGKQTNRGRRGLGMSHADKPNKFEAPAMVYQQQ